MKKFFMGFLVLALFILVGATLVLAGASKEANDGVVYLKGDMKDKLIAMADIPSKAELRAITVSDYKSSLGIYNPKGASYEVPGEKVILIRN